MTLHRTDAKRGMVVGAFTLFTRQKRYMTGGLTLNDAPLPQGPNTFAVQS